MEEFIIIFHTSVGWMGSARCFSPWGLSTYTQLDVSGFTVIWRLEGLKVQMALTELAISWELSSGSYTQLLHVALTSHGLAAAGFWKASQEWVQETQAEATSVLRPSLWSPRTSALPHPADEENHCGRSIFEARRTRIHSFFFPSFFNMLWKCDETWEIQSYIQLYCMLQKWLYVTVYYKNYF